MRRSTAPHKAGCCGTRAATTTKARSKNTEASFAGHDRAFVAERVGGTAQSQVALVMRIAMVGTQLLPHVAVSAPELLVSHFGARETFIGDEATLMKVV